jgi:hypothetical protein
LQEGQESASKHSEQEFPLKVKVTLQILQVIIQPAEQRPQKPEGHSVWVEVAPVT